MPAKPLDEQELLARVGAVMGGTVGELAAVTGGASSLVFSTTVDGRPVVLKVCPPGLEPVRNRDMLRQARMQQALEGSAVPTARVLATDAGDPPDVPPFFVMERLPGECIEVGYLPAGTLPPEHVRGRQLDTARLMGELHRLDPVALGVGDEPETTLEQEVLRWKASLDACDEDLKAGTDDVAERLLATVPPAMSSVVLHGDFRTGNVLAEDDHVNAVIDWEIWSRADPRIDLAWFLIFAEDPTRAMPPGMPTADELVAAYMGRGDEPADLDWFRALVRYKYTATGAFITRNARRRGAPVEKVDNSQSPQLRTARELLGMTPSA